MIINYIIDIDRVTESRVTEIISYIDWIHGMVCVNKVMGISTQ